MRSGAKLRHDVSPERRGSKINVFRAQGTELLHKIFFSDTP